jgi:ArsR family transcriptional regulator
LHPTLPGTRNVPAKSSLSKSELPKSGCLTDHVDPALPVSKVSDQISSDANSIAEAMKALGHPSRIEIIRQLAIRDRCCSGDICNCMPLAQSTVSQHIDLLKSVGLVDWQQQGNRSMYTLNRQKLTHLATLISELADAPGRQEAPQASDNHSRTGKPGS